MRKNKLCNCNWNYLLLRNLKTSSCWIVKTIKQLIPLWLRSATYVTRGCFDWFFSWQEVWGGIKGRISRLAHFLKLGLSVAVWRCVLCWCLCHCVQEVISLVSVGGRVWDVFVSRKSFCCMCSICVGVCRRGWGLRVCVGGGGWVYILVPGMSPSSSSKPSPITQTAAFNGMCMWYHLGVWNMDSGQYVLHGCNDQAINLAFCTSFVHTGR